MARQILMGQTVELRGGTLRGTPECPVAGSVKGAKAVVIREPRRHAGPSGKVEDRVVVKPIMGNGAMGFPIELSADHVGTSGFLGNVRDRVTSFFGGGFGPGKGRSGERTTRVFDKQLGRMVTVASDDPSEIEAEV